MAPDFKPSYLGEIATLVKWGVPFGVACRRASEVHRVPFEEVTHLALSCSLDRVPRHPREREANAALVSGIERVEGVSASELAECRVAARYGLRFAR